MTPASAGQSEKRNKVSNWAINAHPAGGGGGVLLEVISILFSPDFVVERANIVNNCNSTCLHVTAQNAHQGATLINKTYQVV